MRPGASPNETRSARESYSTPNVLVVFVARAILPSRLSKTPAIRIDTAAGTNLPFIEAIRQHMLDYGRANSMCIHVTLVPYIASAGEVKTKPTQHSVKNLLELGIQPDVLICRSEKRLPKDIREKIALFCNVDSKAVISAYDVSSIYEVPLVLHREKMDALVTSRLHMPERKIKLDLFKRCNCFNRYIYSFAQRLFIADFRSIIF